MKKNIYLLMLITAILFLPQAGKSAELLTNGSFETGNFTGWTTEMTQSSAWCSSWVAATSANSCLATVSPQHGSRVAMNGFDGTGGEFRLYQNVTIPTGVSARLSFQYRIHWNIPNASNQSRIFNVQIRDTSNNILETVHTFTASSGMSNQNSGWISQQMWLPQYVGQTVRLYFQAIIPQQFTGPGQFELDDVKFESFFPTAANVGVGGRIQTQSGYGIAGAYVFFVDNNGETHMTQSNNFGNWSFDDVEVGQTYVFQVRHREHQFQDAPRVIEIHEARKDIVFSSSSSFTEEIKQALSKSKLE